MPEVVATLSDPAANSYLEYESANEQMDGYLHAEEWLDLEESLRERLLIVGTRLIDQYKPWGPKVDPDQALCFPTDKDVDSTSAPAIPVEVQRALLEYLDMMAAGDLDHLKRLQAEGVSNVSMLGQTATVQGDPSQLPAGARRELDKVWMRHNSPRVKNSAPYESPDCNSIFG